MGISVGTIFKWYNPDDPGEECENGQCVGIVTDLPDSDNYVEPVAKVKFWELCDLHAKIDPDGTGPHSLRYIWQIGQLH
jgi:hypothetical protein